MGGTPTLVNDTWEWDGQSWTQVEADGPSPRSDHVMAFDSIRNRTILFGGAAAPGGRSYAAAQRHVGMERRHLDQGL